MSRIGKKPVEIPDGVTVSFSTEGVVTVKGPKGELKQTVDRDIKVEVKDGKWMLYARQTRYGIVPCMVCTAL